VSTLISSVGRNVGNGGDRHPENAERRVTEELRAVGLRESSAGDANASPTAAIMPPAHVV
jgi:hypothetical protein